MNLGTLVAIILLRCISAHGNPLASSQSSPGKVNWAVVVAGSKDYNNYRHQADACHMYHILKSKGVPESNIILMAYDDIANSDLNPFPGKLFNKPTAKGVPGTDVYAGCKIDYRRSDVTPENFVKIMSGVGNGKVLKSTSEDNVFVYFVDHGGPGLVYFPGFVAMHKYDLMDGLKTMKQKNMFKRLVFYLETCESGSMFEDLDIPGVYAMTAANARESSWGYYCDSSDFGGDMVNGKHIGTCLGDEFSIHMLEDFDNSSAHDTETFGEQYTIVKAQTKRSHVSRFGDMSLASERVSDFVGRGNDDSADSSIPVPTVGNSVSVWELDLHNRYQSYRSAATSTERIAAVKALQAQLSQEQAAEATFRRIAELSYPGDSKSQEAARKLREKPNNRLCEKTTHVMLRKSCAGKFDAGSGFAFQFHQVIVNICADVARGLKLDLPGIAEKVCSDGDKTLMV